jgi:hypothetical protein
MRHRRYYANATDQAICGFTWTQTHSCDSRIITACGRSHPGPRRESHTKGVAEVFREPASRRVPADVSARFRRTPRAVPPTCTIGQMGDAAGAGSTAAERALTEALRDALREWRQERPEAGAEAESVEDASPTA